MPAFSDNGIRNSVSRIAFGSCLRPEKPHEILDSVSNMDPDLFIFMGDNIYADTRLQSVMKRKYGRLANSPGFQRLKQSCQIIATWDDHDYGMNDSGSEYTMKEESENIFEDFWDIPLDSPVRQRPGVYDSYLFGPESQRVQVILLDTRFFRSPLVKSGQTDALGPYRENTQPSATILGEDQWRWFSEQLDTPAKLRIIVSSIQVLSEHHGWEGWANFPLERERFMTLLSEKQADGVLIISGDRHFAEISQVNVPDLYTLTDITSSGLNRRIPVPIPNKNANRIVGYYLNYNFGLIDIDWTLPDPTVQLTIRSVSGDTELAYDLNLSGLTHSQRYAE